MINPSSIVCFERVVIQCFYLLVTTILKITAANVFLYCLSYTSALPRCDSVGLVRRFVVYFEVCTIRQKGIRTYHARSKKHTSSFQYFVVRTCLSFDTLMHDTFGGM